MTRRLIAAAALLACACAPSAQTDTVHTFQIRDGAVFLDGRHVPDALPSDLDLKGQGTSVLEFSGPVTPVIEIDGRPYVLEGQRLVLLSESSMAGQGVLLSEPAPDVVREMPDDRVMPIVQEAYMRGVASQNGELYDRMRRERGMEEEVMALATRIQAMGPGAPRRALRDQLRGLLSDLLVLKHEIRAEEIAVAEQQIDTARRALSYREGHHDDIVEARLRELVGAE